MAWAENPANPAPVPLQGWAANPSFITIPAVRGWTIPHFALFSSEGTLSATVFAIAQVAAQLSGSGSLAATIKQVYRYPAAFTSEGTLAATLVPSIAAAFSGGGTLDATMLANAIQLDAEFASEGTFSAIIGAQIALAAAFASEGTLAATVVGNVYPLMSTLTDNYATQDATKWVFSAGTTVANNQLQMAPASGATRTAISQNTYSMVGSSAEVWAYQPGAQAGQGIAATTDFRVSNSGDPTYGERMYQANNWLWCKETLAGVDTTVAQIAWNTTNMQFWRIRSDGTTVYWETSPDNQTWTIQGSKVAGAGITLAAMKVGMYGTFPSGTIGSGSILWRNFNLLTPVKFITANFSGAGSLAATPFVPFNESNTARTNQPVPAGCTGCYVTLFGGGGGGGGGPGSGGSGGGGMARTWIPVAQLGSTYSVGVPVQVSPGVSNGAATFSSGSVSFSAGGGPGGAPGTGGSPGGSVTYTGPVAPAGTGTGGYGGGVPGGVQTGSAGGSASGIGGGGGGSGARESFGSSPAGGAGGSGVGGGGNAGAGGAGNWSGAGGSGIGGTPPGGGGGGGGQGSTSNGSGNVGAAGSTLVEWH